MLLRSSQVSLSSNYEMDFRYSALYTRVGVYKGRMVALKEIRRKTIDITRRMKKELKKVLWEAGSYRGSHGAVFIRCRRG